MSNIHYRLWHQTSSSSLSSSSTSPLSSRPSYCTHGQCDVWVEVQELTSSSSLFFPFALPSLPPAIHLLVSAGGEPASDICSELSPIARYRREMPIDAREFAPFDRPNLHFFPPLLFRCECDFAGASKVAGLFPWMSAMPFRSALFCRVLAGIIRSYQEFICMIVSDTLAKANVVEFAGMQL